MSLKKFLQNVSLAGRQWDDIQFVCVLLFSWGPAHLLCLMGGALYVWQITVPQITAHHRNGPLKGAFYFLWSRGGNNIKATVKHIKWQRKPWTIYKVQYNAVKNGMLRKKEFNFFTFFFIHDQDWKQCTMAAGRLIILYNSPLCFILPATWGCLEKWGQF